MVKLMEPVVAFVSEFLRLAHERLTAEKPGSGRHATIYRTYLCALRLIEMTFALYACGRVDDINVTFADSIDRTLRKTHSASYTIIGYLERQNKSPPSVFS